MAQHVIESAWKVIPGLSSRDIKATVKFYIEELHFNLGSVHSGEGEDDGRPLTFSSVYVGDKAAVNIYHAVCADEDFAPGWVMIAMGTSQLDDYYDQLVKAGNERVRVVETIEDKPWGYRQFSIKDNDGNKLTFFKFLEGGNPGTEEDNEA